VKIFILLKLKENESPFSKYKDEKLSERTKTGEIKKLKQTKKEKKTVMGLSLLWTAR